MLVKEAQSVPVEVVMGPTVEEVAEGIRNSRRGERKSSGKLQATYSEKSAQMH